LRTAAAGAAAAVAVPAVGAAQNAAGQTKPADAPPVNATAPVVERPGPVQAVSVAEAPIIARPGSDFMLDVLKSLNFEFMFAVPANTFISLHESIINYGNNAAP